VSGTKRIGPYPLTKIPRFAIGDEETFIIRRNTETLP